MDKDIDQLVQKCNQYQQARPIPPTAQMYPWKLPTRPWPHFHLGFVGPMQGIDSHTKWLEVCHIMTSTTATATIRQL